MDDCPATLVEFPPTVHHVTVSKLGARKINGPDFSTHRKYNTIDEVEFKRPPGLASFVFDGNLEFGFAMKLDIHFLDFETKTYVDEKNSEY